MGAQTPTDPKTHVAETRMASEPLNQGQENGTSQKSQSKTPIYYNSQPSHSSPIIYARAKRVGLQIIRLANTVETLTSNEEEETKKKKKARTTVERCAKSQKCLRVNLIQSI